MSSFLHRARVFVWGHPPSTQLERRLLLKIDLFVLSFTSLMYWSNYVNRTNVASAYVSGMREELGFRGNQFTLANSTFFTVGYIVGLVPNNLMLQVVAPRIWLPSMALIWSALSACMAAAKTPQHIMAIRFLQALAESSTFSGSHYILGSWYKEEELGKRSGVFASSAQLGSLFSGVLTAAIYRNMSGYRGLSGWRWLFLVDFFIGMPIALYGFLVFPDTPLKTQAFFLSSEERALAVSRLPPRPRTTMSWDLVKRVLGRWHFYAFSALFAWSSMLESANINSTFQLYLLSEGYSVQQRNYYPLGLVAFAIVTTIIAASVTDWTRSRWAVNPFMSVCLLISSIILLIYNVPKGLLFFAFYLSGAGYAGQASNFAWANSVCAQDDQERGVVLASMNLWSNVVNSFWGITMYPADDAPTFRRGWIAMIAVAVVTTLIALVTRHLDHRERRSNHVVLDGIADHGEKAPIEANEKAPIEANETTAVQEDTETVREVMPDLRGSKDLEKT